MTAQEFEDIAVGMRSTAIAVASRMHVSAEEAEDVAQDAMVKLWLVRDSISDRDSMMALVTVVARRMAIDRLRRVRDTATLPPLLSDDSTPSPLDVMIDDEQLRLLEREIEMLPRTEHSVIMLRTVQRLENSEIAKILGITEGSVRVLLSRSRRRLLQQMEKR